MLEKVDLFQRMVKEAERTRMEKYYGQVARLDLKFRNMTETYADLLELSNTTHKYLN